MEIWRNRRLALEELREKTSDSLTKGQTDALSKLISEVGIGELGLPVNAAKLWKLSTGLLIGQHLEEPELVDFVKSISPKPKRFG